MSVIFIFLGIAFGVQRLALAGFSAKRLSPELFSVYFRRST